MVFERLRIENFRSIGSEGLTVHFRQAENVAVIVGANGAGKSTVLQALALVLGVYPFDRVTPTEHDFNKGSTDSEVLIELYLRQPIRQRDVYQKEYLVFGFRLRYWLKKRGRGRNVVSREHYCFGEDGKNLLKSSRIFKKPAEGVEVDNSLRPVNVDDVVDTLGEMFYLEPPKLETFFDKTSGYSPLGRLFDLYRQDFAADSNTYTGADGKTRTAAKALEGLASALGKVLRTAKLADIEARLSERVAGYSGDHRRSLSVQLGFPSHQEFFESVVSLAVSDRAGQIALPVAKLGTGHKALLRLAVIDTLLSFTDGSEAYTLLIEEPESYLHVHLRRYFAGVLRRLAGQGHQVVITTHAPEFADLERPQEIVRIDRSASGGSVAFQVPEEAQSLPKLKAKVRGSGNEELFFAEHVILTEGQDDQFVIRTLLALFGVDPDAHSISVLDCKANGNLPDYVRLCARLGIDFFVLHDEDDVSSPAIVKRNDKISEAVELAGADSHRSMAVYTPHLEAQCGIAHHGGLEALARFLDGRTAEGLRMTHATLVEPIERFISTRGLSAVAVRGSSESPPSEEG